jgi:dihydrodipicolinate synthase/N-acetylneuraminate lyase
LTAVNEAAVRHDVRREKDLGFWGTLLVTETGTTGEEMRRVIDVAVDEASSVGLRTMLLASFATLDETVGMVKYAEAGGVDLVLVSYPLLFYPRTEDDVYTYTKAVADGTSLGVFLFAINQWNFSRLHPSGFSPRLIRRLVDDCENVVGVKNEIGLPGVGGIAEVFHRFGDRIVVTDPLEHNAPAWITTFGMPFMGTSNYEYMGGEVVRYFSLLQDPATFDEGMELYWRLHPARAANAQVHSEFMPGTNLVHRMVWKYQYWLNGFNGGPIRQPQPRLNDRQMRTLRQGLLASGIDPAAGEDPDFFVGRHPME